MESSSATPETRVPPCPGGSWSSPANYFLSKVAREIGRLTGWREKIFGRRYQAI